MKRLPWGVRVSVRWKPSPVPGRDPKLGSVAGTAPRWEENVSELQEHRQKCELEKGTSQGEMGYKLRPWMGPREDLSPLWSSWGRTPPPCSRPH